jgi:hypothetical protein
MSTRNGKWMIGSAALALAIASFASAGDAQADHGRPARRAVVAERTSSSAVTSLEGKPARAKWGWHDLYVPTFFQPVNGKYDVVIHWHGGPFLQEDNVEKAKLNAIVVSVNMGIGSGPYSDAYASPARFDKLLEEIQCQVEKTGRAPGARLGRVALQAWSAGFGAVGAILSHPGTENKVDAVILADGFHTAYAAGRKVYEPSLEKYARFARLAMKGEKLFVMTHSSIGTDGYPSTTETTGTLLNMLSMEKDMVAAEGPRSMKQIYEVHRGSFHVRGYEGTNEAAHIDHIKGMHGTTIPYLKLRWR